MSDTRACPFCGEVILRVALKCRYCGEFFNRSSGGHTAYRRSPANEWNPGVAALLSLIGPGLGQMYKGQVGSGIMLLISTGFAYITAFPTGVLLHLASVLHAAVADPNDSPSQTKPNEGGGSGGMLLLVVLVPVILAVVTIGFIIKG